mmetsp:Transcript_27424/g.91125  ORF Transcript_27424/g.91125 Transcript_27424/m.91125 type:complete len:365 (-) Transcript_27424:226-1320(-)
MVIPGPQPGSGTTGRCHFEVDGFCSGSSQDFASTTASSSEFPEEGGLQERDRQFSLATSGGYYDEAWQTLIFFDWDDTLFPTSELFDIRQFDWKDKSCEIPADLEEELKVWRVAVSDYLHKATSLSRNVVVLTNSKRPWVNHCVERFFPEAACLFGEGSGLVKVVYADEVPECASITRSRSGGIRCVRSSTDRMEEDVRMKCTRAKRTAMRRECEGFYSQYPNQTWKNILSIGDMPYEHDALQDVTFMRQGPSRERLRSKAFIVPSAPKLKELTLRLQFSRLMLPAYVHFDGSIDVDLTSSEDPIYTLSQALEFPELLGVNFPLAAWGLKETPSEAFVEEALKRLTVAVQEYVANSMLGQEFVR